MLLLIKHTEHSCPNEKHTNDNTYPTLNDVHPAPYRVSSAQAVSHDPRQKHGRKRRGYGEHNNQPDGDCAANGSNMPKYTMALSGQKDRASNTPSSRLPHAPPKRRP